MGEVLITRRGGGGVEKLEDYGDIAYKSSYSSSSTITVTATVPTSGTYLVIVHDTINQNYGYTNLGLTGNCTIVLVKDGVVKTVKSRQLETYYSSSYVSSGQSYYYRDVSSTASATISGTTITITHPWDNSSRVGGMYGTTIFELS